jgi:predicted DNA-binding transcriptional regulator YafY
LARNDRIVRVLSVARALAASRRGVSLKALAEREGWRWRTVYRDRDALLEAGFPIEEPSPGRYRMREGWAAPNLPDIAPDEIAAFFTLRALAGTWRTTALGKPLDRLWAKLSSNRKGQSALLPVGREPWLSIRSPIAIDYRPHDKTIAVLEAAVRERRVVACRYQALSTGEVTFRDIEPGELHWDPGLESLYVIAWCRLRSAVRIFAVHRVLAAAASDERFTPRPEARSKATLKNAFRVWRSGHVQTVRVRFARSASAEIKERVWGPGQRVEEEADGAVVVTLEVAGTPEVARWILGFGGEAEVLAPESLRRDLATCLRAGAALYDEERPDVRPTARAAEPGEEELTRADKGWG